MAQAQIMTALHTDTSCEEQRIDSGGIFPDPTRCRLTQRPRFTRAHEREKLGLGEAAAHLNRGAGVVEGGDEQIAATCLPNQYVHPSILSGLTGNRAAPVGFAVPTGAASA